MYIKVKNTFNSNKDIILTNGTKYVLNKGDEKIVGEYSEYLNNYIFKLLKKGFEVAKIEKEYIKDHMIITESSEKPSDESSNKSNYIGKYALVEYRERSGIKQCPFHARAIKIK